jgi:hypothetical protein
MLTRNERRVMDTALVLCAMASINACATATPASSTPSAADIQRMTYPLVVNNRSDFEVVVYSMSSATTRGQRLGTARPFSTTYLSIPSHALQSQDQFAVQLHAIGATRSTPNWVSGNMILNESLMAQLDIMGDMSGNLKMSSLSARVVSAKTYR